ncbi:MAG: CPBP family intramembrane metalloprotease [Lewinellaceae bacterium]|nr:CPBP family intramembrane metalloprotease [Lewinellaceae bacterium]
MEKIMKRDHVYIVVITLAFLISLWFAKPLREFLSASGWEETKAKLVAGSIVRFFILGALVWAIRKLRFESFNGIGKGAGVRNLHALIIPLGFILMGLMSNFQTYLDADKYLLLLFVLSVFLVGFVEEITFRGLILPLFIKSFSGRKGVLYWSAVLSALMFGSVHFINLFREPGNLVGITSQVFFALSIGVFFAGLLLRTGNIILPALLHGLVNFPLAPETSSRKCRKRWAKRPTR